MEAMLEPVMVVIEAVTGVMIDVGVGVAGAIMKEKREVG